MTSIERETEPHAQWLGDLLRHRHSVRGFLADPVPEPLIVEIFDTARLAPSNNNSQPWHVAVVSGAARDRLEALLLAEVDAGRPPEPAFPPAAAGFGDEHEARQRRNGAALAELLGIGRDDLDARTQLRRRNWMFYGAPHAAFFSMPTTMGIANGVDLGLLVQSVALLMAANGIGTCVQGSLASYPGPVHEVAQIPDGHGIVCGMSFGYPDPDATINRHRTEREPLEQVFSLQR